MWCGDPPKWVSELPSDELILLPEQIDAKSATVVKDNELMRLAQLPEYADAVFMDCDVHLIKDIQLPKTGALFGFYKNIADTSIVVVNGDRDIFKYIVSEKHRRKIKDVYAWPRKILRYLVVNKIHEDLYTHVGRTRFDILNKNKSQKSTKNHQIVQKSNKENK